MNFDCNNRFQIINGNFVNLECLNHFQNKESFQTIMKYLRHLEKGPSVSSRGVAPKKDKIKEKSSQLKS